MQNAVSWWLLVVGLHLPIASGAQVPLFESTGDRQPLIIVRANANAAADITSSGVGSLFIGQSGSSLLAPYPERTAPLSQPASPSAPRQSTPQLIALRQLIADAEAGPLDYDAVQYGALIKPERPPTQMTIGEIYHWIDRTPGQPHAIGRYQFIPKTLRALVAQTNLPLDTKFTPEVQDMLSDILLADAGLSEFTAGQITKRMFMNNLAKIWAGLPNSTGQSHYHGYAGNKASISWARFEREMARIFSS